jgi:hypothetical protein
MQPTLEAVSAQVRDRFGIGSKAYNDFGLKERRVAKRSVEAKAQAAQKALKTRAAHHPKPTPPPAEPVTPPPSPAASGANAKPA